MTQGVSWARFSWTFLRQTSVLSFCSERIPDISKQTLKSKYSYENQDFLRETEMGGSTPPPPQYRITNTVQIMLLLQKVP